MKRAFALTLPQLRLMATLRSMPDATFRELGDRLGVAHPSVVSMLQRLRLSGHVTKDRTLTAKGTQALKSAVPDLQALLADSAP